MLVETKSRFADSEEGTFTNRQNTRRKLLKIFKHFLKINGTNGNVSRGTLKSDAHVWTPQSNVNHAITMST